MRGKFSEHFPIDEEEIKALWRTAMIVLDANTLLNFYRYSDSTRTEFIQVLKELKTRIFVPEQAAYEYFANRLQEIVAQNKFYDETKTAIENLNGTLTRERGHPYVSPKTLKHLDDAFQQAISELDDNQNRLVARLTHDDILLELSVLLDTCVGNEFTTEDMQSIFLEGEARYSDKIPPGFSDTKKFPERANLAEKRSVFGDFIVWKQMQNAAKEKGTGVIFVTDDRKEDWWLVVAGRTIGPRPELVAEFKKMTGRLYHSYKPEQFLRYAKDHLTSAVSPETLEEVAASRSMRSDSEADFNNLSPDDFSRYQEELLRRAYSGSDLSFLAGTANRSTFRPKDGNGPRPMTSFTSFAEQLNFELQHLLKRRSQIFEELDNLARNSAKANQSNLRDSETVLYTAQVEQLKSLLFERISGIDFEIAEKERALSKLVQSYAKTHKSE